MKEKRPRPQTPRAFIDNQEKGLKGIKPKKKIAEVQSTNNKKVLIDSTNMY